MTHFTLPVPAYLFLILNSWMMLFGYFIDGMLMFPSHKAVLILNLNISYAIITNLAIYIPI